MDKNDDVLRAADLPQPGFAPHGEISLGFDDGLLLWDLVGPFNDEAIRDFSRLRLAAYERWALADRWLGAVVRWHGSALMAPAAFCTYRDGLQRFLRSHPRLVAVAWAADPGLEGLAFVREPFARLYRGEGIGFEVFDESASAQRWARAQLQARLDEPVDQADASRSRSMSMNCQKSTQNS